MSEEFDPYEAVLQFHKKFNASVGEEPGLPSSDIIQLRLSLIEEEVKELKSAVEEDDLVEVADAIADLLYVTYGTAVSFGIDIRPIFDEVHRANMTKEGGPRREDGKILKPDNWMPPRVDQLIKEQKNHK